MGSAARAGQRGGAWRAKNMVLHRCLPRLCDHHLRCLPVAHLVILNEVGQVSGVLQGCDSFTTAPRGRARIAVKTRPFVIEIRV